MGRFFIFTILSLFSFTAPAATPNVRLQSLSPIISTLAPGRLYDGYDCSTGLAWPERNTVDPAWKHFFLVESDRISGYLSHHETAKVSLVHIVRWTDPSAEAFRALADTVARETGAQRVVLDFTGLGAVYRFEGATPVPGTLEIEVRLDPA